MEAWGNSTPIHAASPPYQFSGRRAHWKGWGAVKNGVQVQKEHANGDAHGVFWISAAMKTETNYNRSFASIGHFLGFAPRSNFYLVTEHGGVKVNFKEVEGFQQAESVFVQPRSGNGITFTKRETIISASAVRTPHIHQLSGIGRKRNLEEARVDVFTGLHWVSACNSSSPDSSSLQEGVCTQLLGRL
ncbi:choline dehydrogenase [Stagonosporopsis vannaccii]|nr:choline dehydrogenase [Stagonosporopsis vannaccii]